MSRASPAQSFPADQRPTAAAVEKPYTCSRCRRSFRRAEHLRRHIRTHTKERPFSCHCGLSFTRQDLLRRHERISHASDGTSEVEQAGEPVTFATSGETQLPSPNAQMRQTARDLPGWLPQADGMGSAGTLDHTFGRITNRNPPESGSFAMLDAHDLANIPLSHGDAPSNDSSVHPFLDFQSGDLDMLLYNVHAHDGASSVDESSAPSLRAESHHMAENIHTTNQLSEEQYSAEHRRPHSLNSLHDDAYVNISYGPSIPFVSPTPPTLDSMVDEEPSPLKKAASVAFKITESQRTQLEASLQEFRHIIPTFKLPSQHTLSRYLTSFFETFHSYMPFVHIPTLKLDACVPEFILAMATVGAQSRLEHRNGDTLFYAAKSIVMERMRQQEREWTENPQNSSSSRNFERSTSYGAFQSPQGMGFQEAKVSEAVKKAQLQTIRCIFLLLGYASWERPEILREAFGIRSILVRYLRRVGLREEAASPITTWHEWAEEECDRRIKFVAFCFLNMHSVAFDSPPVLMNSEVQLRLPCSTREWDAPTASAWQAVRSDLPQLDYRKALSLLLAGSTDAAALTPTPCPLGRYILMHGVLQRVFLIRELSASINEQQTALPEHDMDTVEHALRSWISLWRISPESSLGTTNGNGPISITSNALLGLAHVRLHLHLGPYRLLEARDPVRTADALCSAPYPERTERLIPALLYSAHALSLPVGLGIDFVAGSQAFRWSVRHALTGFETAVFLSKWLFVLQNTRMSQALSESETKVLQWIAQTVEEAWDSIDRDDESEEALQLEPARLGIAVVEIWARILQGNIQWPIIKFLGLSLDRYAINLRDCAWT